MTLLARPAENEVLGYFRTFARTPDGVRTEITIFRGAPIVLQSCSFSDPFGDQAAQISLPQVTLFDNPGEGDLSWLTPDTDVDIVWQNLGTYQFDWRWEGYIASYDFESSGSTMSFTLTLKGAFYGMDDFLAIPSFPKRPIPYEILIAQAFDQKLHPSRLGQFRMLFPQDWPLRVPEFHDPTYLSFLKPWGVTTGQRWSGFTSRSTGSWEALLTGHVQSLLSVMFASGGGQWSVRNRGHRRPELFLRQHPDPDSDKIIEITLGSPGVDFSGSRDYTQRASVIYGQGVDDAGVSFSGLTVSNDGATSLYKPFAFSPTVWPRTKNPMYDRTVKPREVQIKFQDGVDEVSATKIAEGQYQRFAEPGVTGSITLKTDVRYADGTMCPRYLIRAGDTIRVNGFFGIKEGLLIHATEVDVSFSDLTVTINFDSKYRDQLTVAEVKARTRDALTPLRALQVGKYSNTVQDLVLPWSYAEGSGCIPQASKEFYLEKIAADAEFPYENWTKKFPPSNPAYRPYYIRVNPTSHQNSSKNWSGVPRDGEPILSIPIRMGQQGTIRLSQLAAYDKNGNVLPVRFHWSIYSNNGVSPRDTPYFATDPDKNPKIPFLHPKGVSTSYAAGQNNPFFKGAWEMVNEDGTNYQDDGQVTAGDAGLIVGWGNYFEPAGYSPGRASRGAARTGLFQDETTWTWQDQTLDLQSPQNNKKQEYAGMLFVQIFCDEQGDDPVYFLGRLFRQEPGVN